jgi:hypothetical protein
MAETENPPLDSEDWEIVFQAYAEYPILAFILAQHLNGVKTYIQQGREGKREALAALDRAIERLMPHTEFRHAGLRVYLQAVAGTLSTDDEDKARELGLLS